MQVKEAAIPEALPLTSCSSDLLTELANFSDEEGSGVSFYFDASSPSDISHRKEFADVEHLVDQIHSESLPEDVLSDLKLVRTMANRIRMTPRTFRAAFLCKYQHFNEQIELPVASDTSILKIGCRFEILPLLRALEACTLCGVALVENGKARAFSVRGEEIVERNEVLPSADVSLHPEPHRGSWPNHVEANAEERAKRYFRDLAAAIERFARSEHLQRMLVGCREALWAKLESEFGRIGFDRAAWFQLKRFDAASYEVLQLAHPVFVRLQEESYSAFWHKLNEFPDRSAIGVGNVLERLQEGRVAQLFLGDAAFGEVTECGRCDRWLPVQQQECAACGSTQVHRIPIGEWMVRKAMSSSAHIIAAPQKRSYRGEAVGALLRY